MTVSQNKLQNAKWGDTADYILFDNQKMSFKK